MSDELAPTPTEAVIETQASKTPELGSQTPVAEKPEVKVEPEKKDVPKNNSDALKAASERLKAKAEAESKAAKPEKTEAKTDAKAEAKPADKTRDETGKFQSTNTEAKAAVAQEPKAETAAPERRVSLEAPARFNENGKKDWATVPESVKEEVHRAISENEKGIQKHKEAADRYELVKEYDELARKNGREGVHESLKQIREIEQTFERNPIEGLKKITDHFGLNLQAVAAHIMGENPNQQVQEAHGKISELQRENASLRAQLEAPRIVEEFFTNHEDAKNHSERLAFLLDKGIVPDLETAYEYVQQFFPTSNVGTTQNGQTLTPSESAQAHTQAPALNPAGSKSVSGAPTGGISPAAKHPVPKNNREALQRAMARANA